MSTLRPGAKLSDRLQKIRDSVREEASDIVRSVEIPKGDLSHSSSNDQEADERLSVIGIKPHAPVFSPHVGNGRGKPC